MGSILKLQDRNQWKPQAYTTFKHAEQQLPSQDKLSCMDSFHTSTWQYMTKRKSSYLLTCVFILHQFCQGHPTIQKCSTIYTFSFVLLLHPDSYASKLRKYRQLSVELWTFQAMKLGYISSFASNFDNLALLYSSPLTLAFNIVYFIRLL
jgi:hypothetical protein